MKFSLLLTLVVVTGCSQMRRHVASGSKPAALQVMDTAEVEWSALEKLDEKGDNTHALVDTQASDVEIAAAEGGNPDEAEAVEESTTSRPFLKKVRTKRVKFWINYFTVKQRDRFQRFLNNGALYRPIIEKILDQEGVPRELFFVGLIESGYYLGAHSHASAVGPWQFIRGTGLRYGLTINKELDERRDIFKATQAAANYFKDLNNIFSSWELALAAYNSGEYGVIRRITKYKTRDYYQLSRNQQLPAETINYVPKVIAAMHVADNAEKYGFTVPTAAARFWQKTKTVSAPRNTNLKSLARQLGVSSTLLVKLNPELRRARTPSYAPGGYQLRVPADKQTEWMETLVADAPQEKNRVKEIEALREKVLNPPAYVAPVRKIATITSHKVRRGETLSSVARRHKMSLRELAVINKLTVRSKVRIGQVLKLERADDAVVVRSAAHRRERKPAATPIVYRLQNGETLTDVARWFGKSVNELKTANSIKKGRSLHVGAKVKIPDTRKGTYTVRRGDYLIKVAQKFNLNQTALMKLNNLKRAHLIPGQRLVVNLE